MVFLKGLLKRYPLLYQHARRLYTRLQVWRGMDYIPRTIVRGPLKGCVLYGRKRIVYTERFWAGSYECELLAFLQELTAADAVVYDIGANIGYHTLLFAKCACQGTVFAFEPLEEARRVLERNLVGNNVRNVAVIGKAIAAQSGSVVMGRNLYCDQAAMAWADDAHLTFTCDAVNIDDFIAAGHPAPTLLKIDVEGAEVDVLAGAAECLAKYRPLIVCEIHGHWAADQVFDLLHKAGYRLYNIEQDLREINSAVEMPTRMEEGHILAWHQQGVQLPKSVVERVSA